MDTTDISYDDFEELRQNTATPEINQDVLPPAAYVLNDQVEQSQSEIPTVFIPSIEAKNLQQQNNTTFILNQDFVGGNIQQQPTIFLATEGVGKNIHQRKQENNSFFILNQPQSNVQPFLLNQNQNFINFQQPNSNPILLINNGTAPIINNATASSNATVLPCLVYTTSKKKTITSNINNSCNKSSNVKRNIDKIDHRYDWATKKSSQNIGKNSGVTKQLTVDQKTPLPIPMSIPTIINSTKNNFFNTQPQFQVPMNKDVAIPFQETPVTKQCFPLQPPLPPPAIIPNVHDQASENNKQDAEVVSVEKFTYECFQFNKVTKKLELCPTVPDSNHNEIMEEICKQHVEEYVQSKLDEFTQNCKTMPPDSLLSNPTLLIKDDAMMNTESKQLLPNSVQVSVEKSRTTLIEENTILKEALQNKTNLCTQLLEELKRIKSVMFNMAHEKKINTNLEQVNEAMCRVICEKDNELKRVVLEKNKELKQVKDDLTSLKETIEALQASPDLDPKMIGYRKYDLEPVVPYDMSVIKVRYGLFGDSDAYKMYVQVPKMYGKVPSSKALEHILNIRSERTLKFLEHTSGGKEPENVAATLESLFIGNPKIIKALMDRGNITCFKDKLNEWESLEIKNMSGLSWDQFDILKCYLAERKLDIFATESAMKGEEVTHRPNALLHYKKEENVTKENDDQSVIKSSVCATSITDFVCDAFDRLIQKGAIIKHKNFGKQIWIKLVGFKTIHWIKFAVSFLNVILNKKRNVYVVGMYKGPITIENINLVFGRYALQFDEFRELQLQLPVLGVDGITIEYMPVKIFLTGEPEFLSSFMGHFLGPNSSQPCLFCDIPVTHLETNGLLLKHYALEGCKYNSRTFDCIDVAKSQVMLPVFGVTVDSICPPLLHIFEAVVIDIFQMIEMECQSMDHVGCGFLPGPPADVSVSKFFQLKKDHENALQQSEMYKADLGGLEGKMKSCSAIIDYVEDAIIARNRSLRDPKKKCNALVCLSQVEGIEKSPHQLWIECDSCCKWYHSECVAPFQDVSYLDSDTVWNCMLCCNINSDCDSVRIKIKEKLDGYARKFNESTIGINNANNAASVSHNKLQNPSYSTGSIRMLADALQQLGVASSLFLDDGSFANSFLLNVLKLTKKSDGPALLTAPLQANRIMCKKFCDILTLLGSIYELIREPKYLSNFEIAKLDNLCKALKANYNQNFSECDTTIYMHMLMEHISEFAATHKNIGLFFEEANENVHSIIHLSKLFNVDGTELKLRMIPAHKRGLETEKHDTNVFLKPLHDLKKQKIDFDVVSTSCEANAQSPNVTVIE